MAAIQYLAMAVLFSAVIAEEPAREPPVVSHVFAPTAVVNAVDESATVQLFLPKPHQDESQRIVELKPFPASVEWSSVRDTSRINEFMVAEFEVDPEREMRIGYRAVIEFREWKLSDRANRPSKPVKVDRRFLTLTENTGKDHADLRQRAVELRHAADSNLDVARRAYDAACERLSYERRLSFKGANRAWDERVGECGDYAALFVALCRCAKVPARSVAGYTFENGEWQLHIWAEFHEPTLGWVPCDPSAGDEGDQGDPSSFAYLPAGRLALARDFDLQVPASPAIAVPIVQQFLFQYQGPRRPGVEWKVAGGLLSPEPPAQSRERSR